MRPRVSRVTVGVGKGSGAITTRTGAFRQPCAAAEFERRYGKSRRARSPAPPCSPVPPAPGACCWAGRVALARWPTCRAAGPGAVAFSRGAIDVMSRKVGRTWCAGQGPGGARRGAGEPGGNRHDRPRPPLRPPPGVPRTPLCRAHRGGGAAPAAGPDRMQRRTRDTSVADVPGHRAGTPRRAEERRHPALGRRRDARHPQRLPVRRRRDHHADRRRGAAQHVHHRRERPRRSATPTTWTPRTSAPATPSRSSPTRSTPRRGGATARRSPLPTSSPSGRRCAVRTTPSGPPATPATTGSPRSSRARAPTRSRSPSPAPTPTGGPCSPRSTPGA